MRRDRRTGHTFRQLLTALHQASEGKHVLYLSSTHEHAFDMAVKIVTSVVNCEVKPYVIKFESGGYVRFESSLSEKTNGLRCRLILD